MKRLTLLLICICTAAFAQAQTSTISGTVKDLEGSAITTATIKLDINKTSVTNTEGEFLIQGLAAGTYKLTVSIVGFQPHEETITLGDGEAKSLNMVLNPAQSSFLKEIVITSRKKEQLKEDFTSAVTVVNSKTIQDLQSVNNNASDILAVIESRKGISPSRSHGTVLETLTSHGSSCL